MSDSSSNFANGNGALIFNHINMIQNHRAKISINKRITHSAKFHKITVELLALSKKQPCQAPVQIDLGARMSK